MLCLQQICQHQFLNVLNVPVYLRQNLSSRRATRGALAKLPVLGAKKNDVNVSAATPSDPGAVVWPDCQLHIRYVTFTCMPAKLKNIMLQSCG